jgi:leader peptidase (prepilin peptidase) / N-methyltransferase
LLGYALLWFTSRIFTLLTKKKGLGEGDIELLAMIGSFTGPQGALYSLFFGSLLGSCVGLILMATTTYNRHTKIPFGPFLSIGTLLSIFWHIQFLQ